MVFSTGDTEDGLIEIADMISVFVVRDKLFVVESPFMTMERLKVPDSSRGWVKQTNDDEVDDYTRHGV